MKVEPIRTRVIRPPKDDLFQVLDESVTELPEKSILVVSGKVVAIHQGRCVRRSESEGRKAKKGLDELIKEEADRFLPRRMIPSEAVVMTIKNNLLIPNAGVDVSNGNGYFVLWPDDPDGVAKEVYNYLERKFWVSEFGVVVTDSRVLPLRWGTGGVAIGCCGFCPLKDYRRSRDIFGRKSLKVVIAGVADSLAAAAVLVMGEGAEQTPMALISEVDFVDFGECNEGLPSLEVDPDEDLYSPLLKGVEWEEGGSRTG